MVLTDHPPSLLISAEWIFCKHILQLPLTTFNMEIQCPNNDHKTMVTYMRTRTGPNWFRVYYNNMCVIRFTPKDVGRVFGVAKFTPSVNAIREWCYEMVNKYEQPNPVDTHDDSDMSSVSDESTDVFVPPPMVT